jgi:hypothetical protein
VHPSSNTNNLQDKNAAEHNNRPLISNPTPEIIKGGGAREGGGRGGRGGIEHKKQNGRQDEKIYQEIDNELEIKGGGGGKEHDRSRGECGRVRKHTFTKRRTTRTKQSNNEVEQEEGGGGGVRGGRGGESNIQSYKQQ